MTNSRYINFPVCLLKDGMIDIKKVCNDIILYALYEYSICVDGDAETRYREAQKHYGYTCKDWKSHCESARKLCNTIPDRNPKTGINIKMLNDFLLLKKTDFEIASFLGFCAVKSILQTKQYCKLTNEFLLSRMAGKAKAGVVFYFEDKLRKYEKRYHMDKLKEELQTAWGIKIYGYKTRGFYVSIKMVLPELIKQVEKHRKSKVYKQKKEERKLIQQNTLIQLNVS